MIQAQYPIIEEELYSYFYASQYPLILVSSLSGKNNFYVGLNGTEYRETKADNSWTESYKIEYGVVLSVTSFEKEWGKYQESFISACVIWE